MFEGEAKQLLINIEYFMRYEQKKIDPYPSITHHPSPIRQYKKLRGSKTADYQCQIDIKKILG